MSAATWIGVGLLGGAGACARFVLDAAVRARTRTPFPLGILAVNLSGTLALGLLAGLAVDSRLLGAGLLGAYTTFSTWVFDSARLARDGRRALAVANVAVSLVLGLAAVALGRTVGAAL